MLKNVFIAVVLILVLCCSNIVAGPRLDKAIADGIISYFNLDSSKVEIEMRSNRVRPETDTFDSLELEPLTLSEPRGIMPFAVKIYEQDSIAGKGQVRVKIAWFQNVLVASDRIKMHDAVSPAQYKISREEVTSLSDKPLTLPDELEGAWAKRNIRRGQMLTSALVETIPDIKHGDAVTIQYKSELIEITAMGVALETGYIGDIIKVKNAQSRKIIVCSIVDDNTVRVESH